MSEESATPSPEKKSPYDGNSKFKLDKEYTLSELLAAKKEELDKLKLVAEMISQKKRSTADLVRAIMIPVLVAFLTLLSTSIITASNQRETSLNNDKRYVRDIDMEIRRTDKVDVHRSWIKRLQSFRDNHKDCTDAEILDIIADNKALVYEDSIRRIMDSMSVQMRRSLASTDTSLLSTIAHKEKEAKNAEVLLNAAKSNEEKQKFKEKRDSLTREVDKLLATSAPIQKAFVSTVDLGPNTQKQIRAVEPPAAGNVESTPVYWFKEGNFIVCFGTLKVLLNSIDPVAKTINISAFYFDEKNPQSNAKEIISHATLTLGSTMALDKMYTIKFVSIDHAGRNPFTMAAYVSCTKNIAPVAAVK